MYEHSAAGRLIKFESEDGFILDGMLFEANSCRGIVVHIHGNYGNFYNNYFLYRMSCMYTANGYSFMTFNLSGHDGLAEGYWGNQLRYIGGAVSDFERCLVEIDAAVGVANEHAKRVILQGHSLGCERVLYYLLRQEACMECILLSPVDSFANQLRWLHGRETVEDQVTRLNVSSHAELEWLSLSEYGARGYTDDWSYQIPITRSALVKLMTGPAFKMLNIALDPKYYINAPCLCICGEVDSLRTCSANEMIKFLEPRVHILTAVQLKRCEHDLAKHEDTVCSHVLQWLDRDEVS